MNYFTNFPQISYKFGDEVSRNLFQSINSYVDIIDAIKDNNAYFNYYNIQNERPDQVSYKLYEDPSYHWTFYLMNDHIRRSGWPLTESHLLERAQLRYPDTVITTKSSLVNGFVPGDTITGLTSGATATIIRKYADLGQLVIRYTNSLTGTDGEEILSGDYTAIVDSYVDEYLSASYYKDGDGNHVDFDPAVGPGSLLTEVTYYDAMREENTKLQQIKVIKPSSINSIASAFEESLTTDP